MALVLVGVGVFSVLEDVQAREDARRLRRANDLAEVYDQGVGNLDRMDGLAFRFLLLRSHDDYVEFGNQLDEAMARLQTIDTIGDAEDRRLVADTRAYLVPQGKLIKEYLGRLDRQEPVPSVAPADPTYASARNRFSTAAAGKAATVADLFEHEAASQHWRSVVTLCVDVAGLGLVLALALLMRRNHSKAALALAREGDLERAAHAAVQASEAKLLQADRLAGLTNWESRSPFTEVDLSGGLQQLCGASLAQPADLLRRIVPNDRPAVIAALKRAIHDGDPFQIECVVTAADDTRRALRIYAEARRNANGPTEAIFGACQDVTEIDRVQRRLFESRAELKALFDGSADVLLVVDRAFRVTAFNPAAADYALRFARIELEEGMFIGDAFEATFGREAMARAALAIEGEPINLERELQDPSGTNHWFEVSYTPIRPDKGELIGMAFVVRDITERRTVEAQLLQAQKMESVGRLAGGVAHDFNNLLTAIIGYDELATSALGDDDPARADIEESLKAARKAASLTQQLLAFARRQVVAPVDVDLNDLIVNMDRLLQRLIGDDVRLICALAPEPVVAHIDPGQFEQVLVNLAVNARDAMPDGGQLTIESREVVLDREYAASRPELDPGEYIQVSVTDTGTGMPPEVRAQIFEPFFTTKALGKGTGLGLATCYGIAKQAGGHIAVYSEPGHGTTFKFYLPMAQTRASSGQECRGVSTQFERGSGVVLVVEDQAEVRALTERVLRASGYDVLSAPDPMAALELARNARRVDLIVSDVVMPGMDGLAMVDILERMLGSRPVVLMSGFAEEPIMARIAERTDVMFLSKPLSPDRLVREVGAALAAFRAAPGAVRSTEIPGQANAERPEATAAARGSTS